MLCWYAMQQLQSFPDFRGRERTAWKFLLWGMVVLPKDKWVQTEKGEIRAIAELSEVSHVSRTLAWSPHCSRSVALCKKWGRSMTLLFSFMIPWASICPSNKGTIDTLIGIHPYTMHVLILSPSISILNQVAETNSGPMVLLKVNSWSIQIVIFWISLQRLSS